MDVANLDDVQGEIIGIINMEENNLKDSSVSAWDAKMVTICVRGTKFLISLDKLHRHSDVAVSKMLLELIQTRQVHDRSGLRRREKKPLYLNRDPQVFSQVLDYLDTGEIHVTPGTCQEVLDEELDFWGLQKDAIAECCRGKYLENIDDLSDLRSMKKEAEKINRGRRFTAVMATDDQSINIPEQTWRKRWWRALEAPKSRVAKVYHWTMVVVNLVSVLVIALVTVPDCRVPMKDGVINALDSLPDGTDDDRASRGTLTTPENLTANGNSKLEQFLESTWPAAYLTYVDVIAMVLLTVDLTLRFVCCPKKKRFLMDVLYLIGAVTLLLKWTALVLSTGVYIGVITGDQRIMHIQSIFQSLGYLRELYILQALRQFRPLKIITVTLRRSFNELFLLLLLVAVATVAFGCLIYLAELRNGTVWSIPDGIWWAVITMTTVGFGDVAPTGPVGKMVGCLGALTGLLVIALPIPIISANFQQCYRMYRLSEPIPETEPEQDNRRKPEPESSTKGENETIEH